MKLSFNNDKDFSKEKVAAFQKLLNSQKPCVVLHHSNHCGYCHMMRPEFDAFKRSTFHNVAEIESSALNALHRHRMLAERVYQSPMYFPMIIVFVGVKKYIYSGPRTAEGIASFIREKTPTAPASKPATAPASKPATALAPKRATAPASKPATALASKRATAPASKPATALAPKPARSTASKRPASAKS